MFAASAGAVSASVGAISASARVVVICVEAAAASTGVVIGIFGYVCSLGRIICLVHI